MMIGGVKLAGHQTGGQAAKGGADLVAAGGEPLAGHGKDAAGHAGERRGDLHIIGDFLEQAAGLLGLVVPGNPEQVHRIDRPEIGLGELILDLLGDEVGVLHLCDGGDDDVVFSGLLNVMSKAFGMDRQIDHDSSSYLMSRYEYRVYFEIPKKFAILSPDFVISSAPLLDRN